ncbi:MAG: hypothetical protein JOZ72_09360 [Alphaproteobacteria bacterium]|nr:hypothetical protein [Alphaproteobacteria bacterium]
MSVLRSVGLASVLAIAAFPAGASAYKVLHSFCAEAGCADGQQPHQIVLDRRGNLVGPTFTGQDATLSGTLFQLQPRTGQFEVLHDFCSHVTRHCLDGSFAFGAPSLDAHGNLYGGTEHGGKTDNGIVYKLTPRRNGGYRFDVIYDFCPVRGCRDGKGSDGIFAIDAAGNVYGTAFAGGAHHHGVLFELSPGEPRWTYKVLYDFCAQDACAGGDEPTGGITYAGAASGLPYDGVSALYGATHSGGAQGGRGVVYQITPGESGWSEKVLFTFCRKRQCQGGAQPAYYGAIQLDGAGNIYGATAGGSSSFEGLLYKLAPSESGEWTETVLHQFDSSSGILEANPVLDAAGNLVGTTSNLLYKLDLSSSKLKVLHSFCSEAQCADGSGAEANVVIDAAGRIYGTTNSGGAAGFGTVFQYTP